MRIWSKEENAGAERTVDDLTTPEGIGKKIDQLMIYRDVFSVADLLCKQSPEMLRQVQPNISSRSGTHLVILENGDFEFTVGSPNWESVTVNTQRCKTWQKN